VYRSFLFNVGISNEVLDGLHIVNFKDRNGGHWFILLDWLILVSLFSEKQGKKSAAVHGVVSFDFNMKRFLRQAPTKQHW
jgi:hypothetical protein